MDMFFDKHGTVVLLYGLVLLCGAATFFLGLKHPDNATVFNWAAGFTSGAFAGLTVAMKVGGNGVNSNLPPKSASTTT